MTTIKTLISQAVNEISNGTSVEVAINTLAVATQVVCRKDLISYINKNNFDSKRLFVVIKDACAIM